MLERVCVCFFIHTLCSRWWRSWTLRHTRLSLTFRHCVLAEGCNLRLQLLPMWPCLLPCWVLFWWSWQIFEITLCSWKPWRLKGTKSAVLCGQRKARPALLLVSPWGFLTQNNIKQKVCFLGLLKNCRYLVLYRGQIVNHSALPTSASSLLFVTLVSFQITLWCVL